MMFIGSPSTRRGMILSPTTKRMETTLDGEQSVQSLTGVAREILYFAEGEGGEAALLVDEEYTQGMTPAGRRELCGAIITITRDIISRDLDNCNPEDVIEISPDPAMENMVFSLRFLITEEGEHLVLTYFGSLAQEGTPLERGLTHILEALVLLSQAL